MGFLAGSCQLYSMKTIVFTVLALLGALLHPAAVLAQQSVTDVVYGACNTATFSLNDSFAQNLNAVMNSLKQNSSQLMYSLTSSQTGSQSNYVYGLYQCRGDVSISDCSSCVSNGVSGFLSTSTGTSSICRSLARGARVWYTGCYLRYENYIFYDGVEKDGDLTLPPKCKGSSNESTALYQRNVATALENSAAAAPKHARFGYNATTMGSGSNTAYALTQCWGYLNSSQCAACLSQVSNYSSACNRSVSGEVYFTTCYYLFSNTSILFTYNNPPPPSIISQGPTFSQPPTIAISALAERRKNHTPAIIAGIVVGVCLILATVAALALRFLKRRKNVGNIAKPPDLLGDVDSQLLAHHEHGATRFSFKELQDATNDFHPNNKLGEGGFGPVYQGRLQSGMEVAIKMLSAQSHQGKAQFLNEVNLITSVQHRNLIQLIGYCVEGSMPLLIYEYLPKRSLDLHLFDVNENDTLVWPVRFKIIEGIARGLRYLHEESPVRIVHRDIKASNILLDNNLNPKIADFGLARLFPDDRSHLTTRVVGTLGYLAPEYTINGQLTEKADVYSFGLVALEIVSGRRVVNTDVEADKQNLLDWTWALYEKQQQLQIVDKRMQNTTETSSTTVSTQVNMGEVIRVVHVALLCTQLRPQARPSMFEVENMLCGQSEILNLPTKPITVGMLSPTGVLIQDSSGIQSTCTMPSCTSEPPEQLTYSYDTEPISQVEPR